MAEFTWTPDFGGPKKKEPAVKTIQFGDGYQQRQTKGINFKLAVHDLTFNFRDDDESAEIEGFLDDRGGVEAFDWTPPTGSASKFICKSWSVVKVAHNLNSTTATFTEVAEP